MDFLKVLFTIILYLNVLIAIASFIFAFILLRRTKGNAIYFNFGMATLFLGLWITSIPLIFLKFTEPVNIFLTNTTFLFGIWILQYFLIFTIYFPTPHLKRKNIWVPLLYLLTLLISFSIFIPNLYTVRAVSDFPYLYVKFNAAGLTIYTLYFIALAAASFKNLIYKYRQSDGIFKIQLKKIILGTGIAVAANLALSITIYYFTEFDFSPIGALFTFAVLAYIYSILFGKRESI